MSFFQPVFLVRAAFFFMVWDTVSYGAFFKQPKHMTSESLIAEAYLKGAQQRPLSVPPFNATSPFNVNPHSIKWDSACK
jgi:hypothetical protein